MKTQILTALTLMTIGAPALAQAPDRAALNSARQECAAMYGLNLPEPGQRPRTPPSEADREKFKLIGECMTAKGFPPPPHGARGHRPPRPSQESRGGDSDDGGGGASAGQ